MRTRAQESWLDVLRMGVGQAVEVESWDEDDGTMGVRIRIEEGSAIAYVDPSGITVRRRVVADNGTRWTTWGPERATAGEPR
jgi:hypothetical protein